MKKRILSFLLACILVFSSLPAISAQGKNTGTENDVAVGNYQELVAFLEKAVNLDEAYCKLTADITAPADCDFIGGYNIENVHIEGNGYTVTGLKIKDSLFGTFKNSTLRNITFDKALVESSLSQENSAMAVVAQSVEDKNSNITGCVFSNCTINLPETETDVAFVAVKNKGVVTNCVVEDTSYCKSTCETSAEYRIGGITVDNVSGSKVINCISKIGLELSSYSDSSAFAGITVSNKGKVDLCYVSSDDVGENRIVADTSSTGNSAFRESDHSFVLGKTSYSSEDIGIMTAEMSQNAMNYVSVYESSVPLTEPDYPALWCVDGGEPKLSFDLKTAQVYLIADESMDNALLEFSLGAEEVSVKSGKRFSLAVGKYENGEYKRNRLDITYSCQEGDYKMINSFVYSPAFNFIENLINPYESTNYSKTFIKAQQDGTDNVGSVELLPYCWKLSISNVSENDELVDYDFGGKGTEDDPYTINNAYELTVLSHYVAEGRVNDQGNRYNAAHYLLTADINNITLKPIGRYGSPYAFKGTFDGGSHTISNLKIVDEKNNTDSYMGLFGYVLGGDNPAVIKNLNVVSADINTTGDLCGVIAGTAQNAIINGCVTSGKVSGGTQVAGIVGYANRSKIYNCGSTASLTTASPNASAGGIVGYSEFSNLRNCYFAGSIANKNVVKPAFLRVGGVTGYLEKTTLDNCFYCLSDAEFTYFDAFITGVSRNSSDELKSDAFLSQIKEYSSKASFGTLWGKDTNNINSGFPIIYDSSLLEYSILCIPTDAGTVSSDVSAALKGTEVTLTVNSQYDLKEIQITNLNREIQNIKCSRTKDGKYVFKMPDYSVRVVPVFDTELLLIGKGTEDDPYIIRNYLELSTVANNCYYSRTPREGCEPFCYAYYEVANDIDCEDKGILPMGNRYYPFNAHFDGNGYTISNLKPNPSAQQISHDYAYPAVFGYCGSAEIHDLTLEGIKLSGNRSAVIASTVWGNTVIRNVTIRDCVFDGVNYGGGFVSQCTDLKMVNCLADNITFTNSSDCGYILWSIRNGVYLNNILVANSVGTSRMIYSSNATIEADDFTDYYVCNTDISDEKVLKAGTDRPLVTEVDAAKLTDKEFIAELSENAYYIKQEHEVDNVEYWGLSDKIEIAHKNGVVGILPIHYDAVFSDPYAFDVFLQSVKAAEINSTVEIPCSAFVDLSKLTVTTASGKKVGFALTENSNSSYCVSFVMPNEPVYIGNSQVVPQIEYIPGSGTEADPYRVSIPEHIWLISRVTNGVVNQVKDAGDVDYIKAQFVLMNDVDMSGVSWELPIGTEEDPFTGVFDGKNYSITNLTCTHTESQSFGFFGVVKGADFKNLSLEVEFSLEGATIDRLGGLCGYVLAASSDDPTVLSDCTVSGSINVGNSKFLGGLCGDLRDYNRAERCINRCNITSDTSECLGGIAGLCRSSVNNCANFGTLHCTDGDWAGGISGGDGSEMNSTTNCYNAGDITGNYFAWNEISYNIKCVSNSYYLAEAQDANSSGHKYLFGAGMYRSEFESGEVAYLLNKGTTDGSQVWYQNLDNEAAPQAFPDFDQSGINTVYKNTTCIGELIEYSNTEDEILHDYNSYNVCKKCVGLYPGKISGIWGFSVCLGGNIGVNYYMVLDDKVLEDPDAKMVFTVPDTGSTYTVEIPVSEAQKQGDFYIFTCEVAAKEMTSQIACQIVTENMQEGESDVFYYKVKQYADYILANEKNFEKEIGLVKSMLNYGAYAQLHFEYRTDDLANTSEYIGENDKVLADVDLSEYQYTYSGLQEGVEYYATSLVLKSETAIKHYFIFDNPADTKNLYITVDSEEVTPTKNGSYYNIRVSDIPAHKLHELSEVRIGEFTLNYGVFSYGYDILTKSSDETLKNVIRALYAYNQEAILYKYGN